MTTKARITDKIYSLLVVPVPYTVTHSSLSGPDYPAEEGNHG